MSVVIEKLSPAALAAMLAQAAVAAQRRLAAGALPPTPVPVAVNVVAEELLVLLRGTASGTGILPVAADSASPDTGRMPVPPVAPPGLGLKDPRAMQIMHDRLITAIRRVHQDDSDCDARRYLSISLDVLCWTLGCKNNRAFAHNAHTLTRMLWKAGVRDTVAAPVSAAEAVSFRLVGDRFILVRAAGRMDLEGCGIQCLTCLMTSWNGDDVANLFCGRCKVFHDESLDADFAELAAACAGKPPDGGGSELG